MAFSLDEITDDVTNTFKGGKMNKGTLLMIGVVIVILLVLFRQRSTGPAPATIEAETIPDVELAGYPQMNPAELEDTFANYTSVLSGQMNSTLEGYYNDIMEQTTDLLEQNKEYIDDVKEGLEQQMGTDPVTVEKKNSAGWTVGYGIHGEGNPNSNIDLKKDRNALKEEIERTNSVIEYRKAQGLDVSEQNKYLNKIKGY